MNPKQVALYARVSSTQQADAGTIESQLSALRARIAADSFVLPREREFVDDGYSGSSFLRPGLERLRDTLHTGDIDRLYVLAPDRLARKYAYQVVLLEESSKPPGWKSSSSTVRPARVPRTNCCCKCRACWPSTSAPKSWSVPGGVS